MQDNSLPWRRQLRGRGGGLFQAALDAGATEGGKGLRKAALDAATTEEGESLRKAALDAGATEEGEIDYL